MCSKVFYVYLDLIEHNGNTKLSKQDVNPFGALPVHNGTFPVLQTKSTTMAKFNQVFLTVKRELKKMITLFL